MRLLSNMPEQDHAILINNVTVMIGDIVALDDISLTIEKGEFTAVVGPNGGGKTTLIRTILGLQQPTTGSVCVFGQDPRKTNTTSPIGYVPQLVNVDLSYPVSVFDVVLMGVFGLVGVGRRVKRQHLKMADEAIEKVGLSDLKRRPIGRLSGGQRQRAFIARALACRPELLILDEPTTGVDPTTSLNLYSLLRELNSRGVTIMLVSHDIGVTATYVDKIVCLNRSLVAHGRPEEAITHHNLAAMYGCDVAYLHHGKAPHVVVEEHDD